jgi:hypothetical protein
MYNSRCYNGRNRSAVLAALILAAAIAHKNSIDLVKEKAYKEFLRKAIRGEIILSGAAGITLVQTARGTDGTNSTTFTVTFSQAPATGNRIFATISTRAGNYSTASVVSGISQPGVTWTQAVNNPNPNTATVSANAEVWQGVVNGSSPGTVATITISIGTTAVANMLEFSGISGVVDKTAQSATSQTGTTTDSGTTPATTYAVELLVASIASASSSTQASPTHGFTLVDGVYYNSNISNALLYLVTSATQTANTGTTTTSDNYWAGCIATFTIAQYISTVSDTGTGSEALVETPTVASLTDSETGTGTEYTPVAVNVAPAYESGAFTENDIRTTGVLPYYSPVVLEEGGFSEVFSVAVYTEVDVFESVAGTELLSTVGGSAIHETGTCSDLPGLSVTFTVGESVLGTESWGIGVTFTVNESGTAADSPSPQAGPETTDRGTGTETLKPGPLVTTGESGAGTEITQSVLASLKATDSGAGTEFIADAIIQPTVDETGIFVELTYTVQGQIIVDGTSFSHVLTIQLDELVNMTNLPASDGLPNQVYQGGKGRKLTITGYTTDPVEFAMLLGLAENSKHFFMLPTGESFYAYVAQVPKPKKAEDGVIYNYSFVAQEAID